jgi:arabinogalactan oligomer/maltooligosaccharide transport system substrate-binding protein
VFVTAAQAGKGPDLVMGAHDWIGNLVQNGTIDPLQLTDDTGRPSTSWPSRA